MKMIKDITPELLEKIETDFKARINSNSEIRSLFAKSKQTKLHIKMLKGMQSKSARSCLNLLINIYPLPSFRMGKCITT